MHYAPIIDDVFSAADVIERARKARRAVTAEPKRPRPPVVTGPPPLALLLALTAPRKPMRFIAYRIRPLSPLLDWSKRHALKISTAEVIAACAREFDVSTADIIGPSRYERVTLPRQVAIFLAHHLSDYSYAHIAKRIGGRDHSTIRHAVCKIEELCKSDLEFAARVYKIRGKLLALTASSTPGAGGELARFADCAKKEMADAVLTTPAGPDQEPIKEVSR